jgi:hypothetical protein
MIFPPVVLGVVLGVLFGGPWALPLRQVCQNRFAQKGLN